MQALESIFNILKLVIDEFSADHFLLEYLSFLNSYLFLYTHTNLFSIFDPRQEWRALDVHF
jgi:hypothetical protein